MTQRSWILGLSGLIVIALVAVAGNLARRGSTTGCALDGMRIDPRLRVRLVDAEGRAFQFCSIRCAEYWLTSSGLRRGRVYLTDEMTEEEVELGKAYLVKSRIVTHPLTGERRHVFRSETDAKSHAEAFHGHILTRSERPFAELTSDAP